ncbi:hypothetical protein [Mesorhizobium captivum]|uniref:hypothetical protein n=1 Tax=Mesorhizobium captivum TaxID=3072319 RepID=UPI002A24D61D|nr:hypothetical protein [Mesorhizobium sp. VK23E]MDX8513503.1 hypothetical protein [Mesorhizobium sp. VK23E]
MNEKIAAAAMERAFGIGVDEARKLLETDSVAKRIYDCAILAIVDQIERDAKIADDTAALHWRIYNTRRATMTDEQLELTAHRAGAAEGIAKAIRQQELTAEDLPYLPVSRR